GQTRTARHWWVESATSSDGKRLARNICGFTKGQSGALDRPRMPPDFMSARLKTLRHKKWLCLLVGAIFIFVLSLLGGVVFSAQILSVESLPRQADVLVVLGGGAKERASRAAALFKEGATQKIIVSGLGDTEQNPDVLVSEGVPLSAIELETK